jgi:predicted nuclease of predicted toxin-antitoxin system
MAALLADENYPLDVVIALRTLGHDVVRVQEIGLDHAPDDVILTRATAVGRAVISHDRDYRRLHCTHRPHAGIVLCSVDLDFPALALRIHQKLLSAPTLTNQLLRVYRPSIP